MKNQQVLACVIYDECMEWCMDYLENEIDFNSFSIRFLTQKIKLHEKQDALFHLLTPKQQEHLNKMEYFIEKRSFTLHEKNLTKKQRLNEKTLKKRLLEIIKES